MHFSAWRLDGYRARLVAPLQERLGAPRFSAALDVLNPAHGLAEFRTATALLEGLSILGVELPIVGPADAAARVECYVRQGDLIATYSDAPTSGFRTQCYWRTDSHACDGALIAVELVTSLQTGLLDTQPSLWSMSRAVPREILVVTAGPTFSYRSIALTDDGVQEFDRRSACGCFLFRLGNGLTYVEMVHPDDFHSSRVTTSATSQSKQPLVELNHAVIAHHLEKGVIMRSRVLGLLIDETDDREAAGRHYRQFSDAPLPLTT